MLDGDLDGLVAAETIDLYDLFQPYAPAVLAWALRHWRYASGHPLVFTMDDFVRFVDWADDRSGREAQRFWFGVLDVDGDGRVGPEDAKFFYDAVEKAPGCVISFEDLWAQIQDMVEPADPRRGFTFAELRRSQLGHGVIGLLTNHNSMLLQRTTAEWQRGEFPL